MTQVNEGSTLTKRFFKIMQCAFNLSNSGVLRSCITAEFKIQERPICLLIFLVYECLNSEGLKVRR